MDCQGRGFLPEASFQVFWCSLQVSEGRAGREVHLQTCYLLAQDAHLLSRQVVQGEDEPPVKAALPRQGVVVDICLLHVLL